MPYSNKTLKINEKHTEAPGLKAGEVITSIILSSSITLSIFYPTIA